MLRPRFLHRLVQSLEINVGKDVTEISAEAQHQLELKELESLCKTFDRLHNEARMSMWNLLKIPLAPATIIAVSLEAAVLAGGVQKEVGYLALMTDITWALYKVVSGLHSRSVALAGKEKVVDTIQNFLTSHHKRASLLHRSLINNHDPELARALADKQIPEYKN